MKRISILMSVLLLAFAALFDVLSLLPVGNTVVVVIGQFVMACLFYIAGVNVFKGKPTALYILATVIEAVPALSILPLFLVETAAIILISRRKGL